MPSVSTKDIQVALEDSYNNTAYAHDDYEDFRYEVSSVIEGGYPCLEY